MSIHNYSIFKIQGENEWLIEFRDITNFKGPKITGGYIETNIEIDNTDPSKNWLTTVSNYD
ncbi:MAG: hypothetical protein ACFFDH_24675 [Promethearchaeota archaeon]